VWFLGFEEPSGRGGREETKTNEKNYCNQNPYSERSHAASLVFAVLCPAADAGSHTGMTNQTELSGTRYASRFSTKYPIGGR
jgi:hypothetical protein